MGIEVHFPEVWAEWVSFAMPAQHSAAAPAGIYDAHLVTDGRSDNRAVF